MAAWASAGVLVASLAGAQAGVLVKAKGTHLDPAVLAGRADGVRLDSRCWWVGACARGQSAAARVDPRRPLASLAYLTVVGSVVAFLAYYWLMRHIEVTRVLLIPLITPLVAVGLGYAFLGERVTWGTALGGAAILGGVGLAVWNGGRRYASDAPQFPLAAMADGSGGRLAARGLRGGSRPGASASRSDP